jgi:hypothetical protein
MTSRSLLVPAVLVLLLAAGVGALVRGLPDDPPPLPVATPVGGIDLLYARPFTLDVPFTHMWRAERPQVQAGWVLVLAVDPALVYPRDTAEPILYVGDQTAERVNLGNESGHVVAIVPAPLGASGNVALDLSRAPIFFGEPGLPEQVDAAKAAAELAAARQRGLAAPAAATVAAVSDSPVHFTDDFELHAWCSDLIQTWSPQEIDLIAGLRVPRLQR